MSIPKQSEIEAARHVLRRLGGHMRAKTLTKKQQSDIAKKANAASHRAKRKKKKLDML